MNGMLEIMLSSLIVFNFTINNCAERSPKRYSEVFSPLVCSVLEGDYYKFSKILDDTPDAIKKVEPLPFGYNLRHLAYHFMIHARLKRLGVAPLEPREFILCTAEEEYGLRSSRKVVIMRDPEYKDVYGKFPEDYTEIKKKKHAECLKNSYYQ